MAPAPIQIAPLLALLLGGCAGAPPSFEVVAPRLDTISEVSFVPDSGSLNADDLTARWDFDGDGVFESEGPLQPESRRFLRVGDVSVGFELVNGSDVVHSETRVLSIEHPDRWPRTVPTYFIGGFDEDDVGAVLDDPGSTRALMVAGFDLWQSIAQEDDGSWTAPVLQSRIDAVHEAGLLAWVDVARGWAPQDFWGDWDALSAWLVELAEAGIDGIDFDEFGDWLEADEFNELQDALREVNPHIRLVVTQVYASELEDLLDAGATPDYVAAAWYLAGGPGFDVCTGLSDPLGPRCAYWVDPATYDLIEQTYDEAAAVLMWNLCWRPTTCDGEYPMNTWAPWDEVRPLIDGLDSFED